MLQQRQHLRLGQLRRDQGAQLARPQIFQVAQRFIIGLPRDQGNRDEGDVQFSGALARCFVDLHPERV
jgi:hypothetical protein